MYTAKVDKSIIHEGGRESVWRMQLPTCECTEVQWYRVQYKGYNLVWVTTVEEGSTIGTTALVYWQLHSSLYAGAVQGYWSTPDRSDSHQGCRQVSTGLGHRCTGTIEWGNSDHTPALQIEIKNGSQRLLNVFFKLKSGTVECPIFDTGSKFRHSCGKIFEKMYLGYYSSEQKLVKSFC